MMGRVLNNLLRAGHEGHFLRAGMPLGSKNATVM